MVPSSRAGGCQQHPPGRGALELTPAALWLAWLWLPRSSSGSAQPVGGSRCLAQIPKSSRGAAALLLLQAGLALEPAPFPQTPLAPLWLVQGDPLLCPSEPMKSFLIGDILWGMAVALHVAWRVAGQGAMLYKYLLGCAACRAWRVPPSSWVQGMLPERGPRTPLGTATIEAPSCALPSRNSVLWGLG